MKISDPIENHFRLMQTQKNALKKLGLSTIRDLLFHFPSRYENISGSKPISSLKKGDESVIFGRLTNLSTRKAFRKKTPIAEGQIEDDTGKIKVIWFNQPYIAKMVRDGSFVKLSGKAAGDEKSLYIANPEVENIENLPINIGESLFNDKDYANTFLPVYPESRGITSKWFYHAVQKLLKSDLLDEMEDAIPRGILMKYHLPALRTALIWIHTPRKEADSQAARKRFAFGEVFFIQLSKQKERLENEKKQSFKIEADWADIKEFINRFPFDATNAQKKAINEILKDFSKNHAMSRLLEGDVGSGKTAVAAAAVYAVTITRPLKSDGSGRQDFGNLQTAYMVPTEILARQHFESFIEYFSHMPINIGLITSSGCRKFPSKIHADRTRTGRGQDAEKITPWTNISRTQLLKWVQNGEIPILIGTHALIQKTVQFENLAFVIIDEQHRFGVSQRHTLARGLTQTTRRPTQKKNKQLLYKDLTYIIRDCIFTVKKELGLGHKECVYQKALEEEFSSRELQYGSQKHIPIFYRNKRVGTYQPDFVIEEKVIIELKALPFVGAKEKRQLWNYIKGSEYALALLVNFGNEDVSIDRVIYESARSASSPHESAYSPHLLSMTATPIPRTLALTIYGDLDLTLLDEMPKGRKPIITEIVPPAHRDSVYEKVRGELQGGRQAYVITPRIEEPDLTKTNALNAKSVKEEAKRLKKDVFPEYEIGVLHSKIKPKEKEETMEQFLNNEIQILCATSVVEVGVNVPNATVIIIEGAERFGLAQLHQLRGRVLRSTHQAYCYVFTESRSKNALQRLKALGQAKNGFELAEFDLSQRGSGELYGRRQSGLSDIAMEAMKNIKMVEAARNEARKMIELDSELKKYPVIREIIDRKTQKIHFE